ncbi:RNA-dependent RNA polymerase 6, partial [Bidens hawaiensis]|uniref:RNA-dependent RNA polymerase 6 n=1 Tax=Bidens hawaiensis TaxID=980011 RepID=UPI00404A8580
MDLERNDKELIVTQVSVGGFGNEVTAKMLLEYLEETSDPEFHPHAFVHFVDPNSALSVLEASGRKQLVLNNNVLKVSLGPENPYRMNRIRRETSAFKLSNVVVDVGLMTSRDDFVVGWCGPDSGVDFLIDQFDSSCKFLFTKDTAFSFKGTINYTVIKCNYKLEFLVWDINDIKEYTDYMESFK